MRFGPARDDGLGLVGDDFRRAAGVELNLAEALIAPREEIVLIHATREQRPRDEAPIERAIELRAGVLESDRSPTSSNPVARTEASTILPMPSSDRSRTGRVIIPAWQKRQPRVQPRKISTDARSCTVSASGTSGAFG